MIQYNTIYRTLFLFFLSIGLINSSMAQSSNEGKEHLSIWGRVVQVPKSEAPHGESLFIHYTKDGQHYLYPISSTTENLRKLYKKKGEFIQVKGEFEERSQFMEGQNISYRAIRVDSYNVLTFSQLKVKEEEFPEEQKPLITYEKEKYAPSAMDEGWNVPTRPGGVVIPDDITNATIAVSGAILLGKILAVSLQTD